MDPKVEELLIAAVTGLLHDAGKTADAYEIEGRIDFLKNSPPVPPAPIHLSGVRLSCRDLAPPPASALLRACAKALRTWYESYNVDLDNRQRRETELLRFIENNGMALLIAAEDPPAPPVMPAPPPAADPERSIEFNINGFVGVTLTTRGCEILAAKGIRRQPGDFFSLQLYEMMRLFGPEMQRDNPNLPIATRVRIKTRSV